MCCFCFSETAAVVIGDVFVAAEAEAVDECLASEAADTVNFFAGRSLLGTVAEGAGVGA